MLQRTIAMAFFCLGVGACTANAAPQESAPKSSSASAPIKEAAPRTAAATNAGTPASTLYCQSGAEPAQTCRMEIKTEPGDANMTLEFTFASGSVRFKGQHQSAWWSGQLNGKPAMGYELNRGHTLYSTTDLSTTFAWWYGDMQHGSY